MGSNQDPRPRDTRDEETRGIPEAGSDVEQVRNEEMPEVPKRHRDDLEDIPQTTEPPKNPVRSPGQGPKDDIEFDRNPVMADDDSARPAKAGIIGTGMFFPAVIIIIVAIVVILWFVL